MSKERNFLGEYLLSKGIVSQGQLNEALEEQKRTHKRLGNILVSMGFVQEADITKALSEQLGIEYLELSLAEIKPEVAKLIPRTIGIRLQAVAVSKTGNILKVAMANPLDVVAIDEIKQITKLTVTPVFATSIGIKEIIEKIYPKETVAEDKETPASKGKPASGSEEVQKELSKIMDEAEQAAVIKLVDQIMLEAVKENASDIHLEPQEKIFYCRFRIDGVLYERKPIPKDMQSAVISRIKIMANMNIAEKRLPQDGRIITEIGGRKIDLRIATFPTIYGEHVSLRILDKTAKIITLQDLGFLPDTLQNFDNLISRPYGIIFVTGPTGSGKSTTLYAALNKIDNIRKNVFTLEDPVEYTIERVHQSQINVKAGFTFASGLRSILRHDPDVIMIGEVRDKETAEIAIHSALTGHLVLTTLHTNDAPSSVTRLIDMGTEPFLVASSILGILAQRLVRKLCPKCKKSYKPTKEEINLLGEKFKSDITLYKEQGCPECNNTGYRGRIGIFELLILNNDIKNAIVKGASSSELKTLACNNGMKTLREDGIAKVISGITTLSEILRITEE